MKMLRNHVLLAKSCHAHFSLKAVGRVTSLVSPSSPRTSCGLLCAALSLSHEQTETNPAQPRERLENAGERHLRRSTDCLGKPLRGGLAADERRNAQCRKSRRVIRAAPR